MHSILVLVLFNSLLFVLEPFDQPLAATNRILFCRYPRKIPPIDPSIHRSSALLYKCGTFTFPTSQTSKDT